MTETELMRPEILRSRIMEIIGLRKFKQDAEGLNGRVSTIDELFAREVPTDKIRAHLGETQQAILGLAEHGYPNKALEYLTKYTTLYSKLSV